MNEINKYDENNQTISEDKDNNECNDALIIIILY
jgi:hypothetical protein